MSSKTLSQLVEAVSQGNLVPYLGPGIVSDVRNTATGETMPADSDSLILAMNNGTPMAPRLMYEFPRAAMHMEHKKGRQFVVKFFNKLYTDNNWSRAAVHDWLALLKPAYVVDTNRDTQLQLSYADTPHLVIQGISRISGTDYRFRIFYYDGSSYQEIDQASADPDLPILFKPLGTPLPDPSYIAADADFVDYITELMGGFAIPTFLKDVRKDKQYLFIGMSFDRDTERMIMSDIIYDAKTPLSGYALIPDVNEKEARFLSKKGIEVIAADWRDLLAASTAAAA